MKTIKITLTLLIAMLVLSVWTPAKAAEPVKETKVLTEAGPTKYATVVITNQTGGSIYLKLNIMRYRNEPRIPAQDYFLLANKPGVNQFLVLPGRYTYTLWASNCGGFKLNTKIVTGTVNLGSYYCDK